MSRLACLVLLVSTISLVGFDSAARADGTGCVSTTLGQVASDCILTGTETVGLFAASGSSGDGHTYAVRPKCGDDSNGEAICTQVQVCTADDGEAGIMMILLRDGDVYGETCLSDTQAGDLGVITPGLVLREFKRLTWPQSPLTIQPPGGKTAVNFTTYYFTDNVAPTTQTVQIIGQEVEIEATPTSYVYRFGDRDTVETRSPGGPYPSGDVTHQYRHKGTAGPSIDTVYSGRYRVNGGAWNEIPETVTVEGTPVTLRIVEVRPTLVAPAAP
jgi:hypothetical protein